ncbi:MAG: 3-isopropylmalate dehydratase large subunit [Methanobacteriota archaeon]|nr:MAG: 3-isopropylmalate dehydratase large subunit [Euryarchaeota archaeon]
MPPLTMSEKILAKASGNESVRPGQIVDGSVDLLYMHEMLAMALIPFGEIGTAKVWDPTKIVVTLDHWVPPPTPEIAKMHQTIRDFCRRQGIQRFHDVGDHGIVHQLIAERGYAHPWDLVIGSDSHTNMVGALGAFAAGIGATDTAAVMATGRLWLRVPETIRVDVRGTLGRCTGAKDVILKVIGTTGDDGARYAAVEFAGPTVEALPMNERFVLCNMTTEMGAKVGMIAADETTKRYLAHNGIPFRPISSDDGATFAKSFAFDVDGMGPQVACPSNPANLKPVEEVQGTKIDVAFLGSCTNARIEDLRIAAELLKGEKVAPGVRFQITPASQIIYRQALEEGLIEIFMDAGATFTSSTCGPCFGGHLGTLAGDEVCISSTNRNYPGRMGSPQAQVYLASPWTVTASAIHGEITDPRKV